MPFDRLIRAVDDWAGRRGVSDVFAQVGPTDLTPRNIAWSKFIEASEFRSRVMSASVVVAHAGMGSILTALELGKPILVMPRRGDLRETRNDHQVATAKRFLELGRVAVAFDEGELADRLDHLSLLEGGGAISPDAPQELIHVLRDFING